MARIAPEQAFTEYLALDGDRSLDRLHAHLTETSAFEIPSRRTIAAWSSKFDWQRRAEVFERQRGQRVVARVQTAMVRGDFDRVQSLMTVAQQCLDDAAAIRVDASGASAQDKRSLVAAAIEAIKMVEVLTGGVSERTERVNGMASEAAQLLRQLEEQKRRRLIDVTPQDRPSSEHDGKSQAITTA